MPTELSGKKHPGSIAKSPSCGDWVLGGQRSLTVQCRHLQVRVACRRMGRFSGESIFDFGTVQTIVGLSNGLRRVKNLKAWGAKDYLTHNRSSSSSAVCCHYLAGGR
ncbi:MAG TPA: hypothetical protein VEB39_03710 [Sphingomicrobium sp.]|nr:hypothetical protein [Sphingomicrobium sp.]